MLVLAELRFTTFHNFSHCAREFLDNAWGRQGSTKVFLFLGLEVGRDGREEAIFYWNIHTEKNAYTRYISMDCHTVSLPV